MQGTNAFTQAGNRTDRGGVVRKQVGVVRKQVGERPSGFLATLRVAQQHHKLYRKLHREMLRDGAATGQRFDQPHGRQPYFIVRNAEQNDEILDHVEGLVAWARGEAEGVGAVLRAWARCR